MSRLLSALPLLEELKITEQCLTSLSFLSAGQLPRTLTSLTFLFTDFSRMSAERVVEQVGQLKKLRSLSFFDCTPDSLAPHVQSVSSFTQQQQEKGEDLQQSTTQQCWQSIFQPEKAPQRAQPQAQAIEVQWGRTLEEKL
jgi:hypothetical protein